jgi:hypothetical protein
MTQPFVYIVRNINTGMRYAGVKYAKNCQPSDLLVTYLTSSKIVKSLLKENINCFEITNIIEFENKEDAIEFEEVLLSTVDAASSHDWYNQANGKAINSEVVRRTCNEKYGEDSWMKTHQGKLKAKEIGFKVNNTFGNFKRSDLTKLRMSVAFTGRVYSDDTKKNMSNAKKGKTASYEVKRKMSESRQRGDHPRAIKIVTPAGIFDCINDAADYYNVCSGTISKWLKSKPDYFYKYLKTNKE